LAVMTIITVATGMSMIALVWIGDHAGSNTLYATLTTNPKYYNLSFGHMHDLTSATFRLLSPLVYQTAAILIVGPLGAFLFAVRKRWMFSFMFLAAMMIGVCH